MNLEGLIIISIVLHIITTIFLFGVTVYTAIKLKKTQENMQKALEIGVREGLARVDAAIKDKSTYDLLLDAVEDRLVKRLSEFGGQMRLVMDEKEIIAAKVWANRMSQFSKFGPEIMQTAAQQANQEGKAFDVIGEAIKCVLHPKGPVGYARENAYTLAQAARSFVAKKKEVKLSSIDAPSAVDSA